MVSRENDGNGKSRLRRFRQDMFTAEKMIARRRSEMQRQENERLLPNERLHILSPQPSPAVISNRRERSYAAIIRRLEQPQPQQQEISRFASK
jgi:hypothetical protein